MLLDGETGKAVKAYLIKALEPICDVDPEYLSQYIIALLNHDKSNEELKESLNSQLHEFLREATRGFVASLFEYLGRLEKEKPKAEPTKDPVDLHNSYDTLASKHAEEGEDEERERDHKHARREHSPRDTDDSRKRRPEAVADEAHRSKRSAVSDAVPLAGREREREDDRGSFSDDERRNGRRGESRPYDDRRSRRSDNGADRGRYERSSRDSDYDQRGAPYDRYAGRPPRGPPRGGFVPGSAPAPYGPRAQRPRCRDYEEKGLCMRGDACPYSHPDRIRVDDARELQRLPGFAAPAAGGPVFPPVPDEQTSIVLGPAAGATGILPRPTDVPYDPHQPTLWARPPVARPPLAAPAAIPTMDRFGNMPLGAPSLLGVAPVIPRPPMQQQQQPDEYDQGPEGGPPRRRFDRGPGGFERPGFGPRGPRQPRNPETATLTIVSIPRELNSIEKLNSHFKQFGTIVNIQVSLNANKAQVQFARHAEALAALRSPEAVLNNRFIKVLWANKDAEDGIAGEKEGKKEAEEEKAPPAAAAAAPKQPGERWNKLESKPAAPVEADRRIVIAPEKKAAAKAQKEDVRKQIATLLEQVKKVADPQKKSELLKIVNGLIASLESSVNKAKQTPQATAAAASPAPAPAAPISREEAKKQILDQELDRISKAPEAAAAAAPVAPAAAPAASTPAKSPGPIMESPAGRGSPFGRGRGMRGRGRGSPRGRGRGRGSAIRPGMTLDNRPTTLIVSGVSPELVAEDKLLPHFRSFGEITSYSVHGDEATIQYATRREAEAAYSRGKTLGSHALQLAWPSLAPAAAPTTQEKPQAEEAAAAGEDRPEEVVYAEGEFGEADAGGDEEEEEGDLDRSWKRS